MANTQKKVYKFIVLKPFKNIEKYKILNTSFLKILNKK